MTPTEKLAAARKYLVELLILEGKIKYEGKWEDVHILSESFLYEKIGKEDARSVLGGLRNLSSALGVNFDHPERTVDVPAEGLMLLYDLMDGICKAEQASRRIRFEVSRLDEREEFARRVEDAQQEIETAMLSGSYATPMQRLARISRALGLDSRGKMKPAWKLKEEEEKE